MILPNNNSMPPLYILVHDIRSLYNVGSLFRLADGLGVNKLFLTGLTGAPHNRLKYQRQRQQIAKTALEALDSVDWQYSPDPFEVIQQLKDQAVTIAALELTNHSYDLASFQPTGPICLVLGHETAGVDPLLLQACDLTLHIPMQGQGKSLNVVTATAIATYTIRQRLAQSLARG